MSAMLAVFLVGKKESELSFVSDFARLLRAAVMAWHTNPRSGSEATAVALAFGQACLGLMEMKEGWRQGQRQKKRVAALLKFADKDFASCSRWNKQGTTCTKKSTVRTFLKGAEKVVRSYEFAIKQ